MSLVTFHHWINLTGNIAPCVYFFMLTYCKKFELLPAIFGSGLPDNIGIVMHINNICGILRNETI